MVLSLESKMRFPWLGLVAGTALAVSAAFSMARSETVTAAAVVKHYVEMGAAVFGDAHAASLDLQKAVDALIAAPSPVTLAAARQSWIAARPWYQHTEVYRFGNAIVDDWEGRVNSWPLDEGLIDYVDKGFYGETSDENALYAVNVIATPSIRVGNDTIDASTITPEVILKLNGAGGSESNVGTGYHAIEFLLWGQDLNGTGPGAGNRPYTDYDSGNCANGNCGRRAAYLKAATDLLVGDLADMAANWQPDGAARKDVLAKSGNEALSSILTGIGSLSYGELAGERMKLGLILHDPEEEHDCFSDNTHNSHYNDQVGMWAVYSGTLVRRDGAILEGPGIQDLAAVAAPDAAKRQDALMQDTLARLKAVKDKADSGAMAYDQMISKGNTEGNALVQAAIEGLVAQTRGVEALVADLKLSVKVEGSDSLDNPSAVKSD